MLSVRDTVLTKPSGFIKTATYELDTDVSNWKNEIIENFFNQIPFLPKDIGIEAVINNVDENKGYAKGSVVVWYGRRKINFPIIVKEHQLYPFDVFITEQDGKFIYHNATENSIKSELMSQDIGKVENMYDAAMGTNVKTPGNISPKRHINLADDYNIDYVAAYPNFTKMSSVWRKEDFDHLKETLEKNADIANSFHETTGDRVNNIINLNRGQQTIQTDKKEGKIDLNNIVAAKQMLTVLDSELFDTSKMTPIKPPSVCEIRLYEYPSMEDFMDTGKSELLRFQASKNGKPVTGVVLDYKSINDFSCMPDAGFSTNSKDPIEKIKATRNSRPQIFICSEGKFYSKQNDYSKSGICFYGNSVPGLVDKIIERIRDKTTNDYLKFSKDNLNDGSDKTFYRNLELSQGTEGAENKNKAYFGMNHQRSTIWPNFKGDAKRLLCIYGAGDIYEAIEFNGSFKRYRVNNAMAFACNDIALIPARVASIQKVSKVTDPVYKMIAGSSKCIYLIPENSVVINMDFMDQIKDSDIMTPDKSIQKIYEEAAITKVSVDLGEEGYRIIGDAVKPLQKLAQFTDNTCLDTKAAMRVLSIIGMTKEASESALKSVLIKNAAHPGSSVSIYGVNNDYINPGIYKDIEKQARVKEIYKQLSAELKTDLIKEASLIDDPEAVDVMLSLNFINEDNLNEYMDQIQIIKKVITKLASLLVASRMGLSDIEEGAVRRAMDGLESVVRGLENIKLSISK